MMKAQVGGKLHFTYVLASDFPPSLDHSPTCNERELTVLSSHAAPTLLIFYPSKSSEKLYAIETMTPNIKVN